MFPVAHSRRLRPWWNARSVMSYERSVWLRVTAVATNRAATARASRRSRAVNSTVFGSGATSCGRPRRNGASFLLPVFEKKTPTTTALATAVSRSPTHVRRRRLRGDARSPLTRPRVVQGRAGAPRRLVVRVRFDRRRLERHPAVYEPALPELVQHDLERVGMALRPRLRLEDDGELDLVPARVVDRQRHLAELAEPRDDGDVPGQPLLARLAGAHPGARELPRLHEVLALDGRQDEAAGHDPRRPRHRHRLRDGLDDGRLPEQRRALVRLRRVPEEDDQEG